MQEVQDERLRVYRKLEDENKAEQDEARKKRMLASAFVMVRNKTGMNRKEFAAWLGIPYRTMQDWELGNSQVPEYVLRLVAYKVMIEKEITVTPEGSDIGVNIRIDKFYDAIENGKPYGEVVDKAVEVINNGISQRPDFDIASLSDYSQMKEKLAMEVVSAEANKEMLETVPHQNIEDMAVVYRFVLSSDDDGRASILVTNQLLENMGVTPEQLHADAMENAPQIKPVEIKGMSEVLAEMMGVEQAEMMGIVPAAPEDEQMHVATVPDKVHGAGVIAYQDFMDKAAERAGGDFFILPSSIHEILIVPDNGKMNLKDLEAMVREVNATQVSPADKLTDSVYHYDSQAKIFELGEKFVERQAEREAEHAEEKGYLLGDLKAKKEEVAKTPKKEPIDKGAKAKGGEAL